MDLSIVIVSWNVRELLERCLHSIAESMGGAPARQAPASPAYEVIVVDNGSTDGTPAAVRSAAPWARVIENNENAGFARANNQGLAEAQGRYLLLLNPDTEVLGDALPAMLDYMDAHSDVGMLGPQLMYGDGAVQSSRRRFPTYAAGFIEATPLGLLFPGARLLNRYYMRDRSDAETQDVDWLVGAALLLRRQAWEAVGALDERFFMYSEEVDYAFRLRTAGWRVVYYPPAQIVHYEAASSRQVVASRWIMFNTAKVQLYEKLFGRRKAGVLRLYLLATLASQWLIEGAKWLLGHKRPLRRQRMSAYVRVIRSGLLPRRLQPPTRGET